MSIDASHAQPDQSTAAPKQYAFLQMFIGAALGAAFWFFFAWLLLHKVIGGRFETEPDLCRFMSSPINMFSIMAFTTAMVLLFGRWLLLRKHAQAFQSGISTGDPQTLILPEDALGLRQQMNRLDPQKASLIPNRLLATALQRARANWSAEDAGEAVTTQAELIQGKADSDYATIRYLTWAIPSIGFVGTVLGIGKAMKAMDATSSTEGDSVVALAADALHTAFDTTFVALILSLIVMYFVHRVQADEDAFLVNAVDWCMKRFVLRMHIKKEV